MDLESENKHIIIIIIIIIIVPIGTNINFVISETLL